MALKEFAVKQVASQLLPLIAKISDDKLGRLLRLSQKLAPTGDTVSVLHALDKMRLEGNPIFALMAKRIISQTKI